MTVLDRRFFSTLLTLLAEPERGRVGRMRVVQVQVQEEEGEKEHFLMPALTAEVVDMQHGSEGFPVVGRFSV